ncbi:gamma-glutamyl-gamma-aminobutyrate hydrolase family protein [Bacillus alveayuensis]|uniref:gamma-glutamyl-gamma-aminobutyrate hydrolase family protein n=1 Tax=Aeribacillus alveayuensis TaxID=279215 RepID=UPI0005D12576|nr:gamma-glutamyl-gamma-aminobutyrate hydrolase family protein [Bacillus alveayuensis]
MRPWIGLTVHADRGNEQDIYPGHPLLYVERYYIEVLEKYGMNPMLIPVLKDKSYLHEYVERLDGVIFTGGGYLTLSTPSARLSSLRETGEERYSFEMVFLQKVIEANLPVFGICRGMQMINELFGGSLKNLEGVNAERHHQEMKGIIGTKAVHTIQLEEDCRAFQWLQQKNVDVNSFHRQVIDQVGEGLVVSAWSDDGYPEWIEGAGDQWIVGTQFHPEQLVKNDERWGRLFIAFREAAKERR